MNLADLRDFIGNLLDYDPTNPDYEKQLHQLINDAQTRVLTDRPWTFSQREAQSLVFTDFVHPVSLVQGSATVTGTAFPFSSNVTLPGSQLDGTEVELVDVAGIVRKVRLAWVLNATTAYLTDVFDGPTANYVATFKKREIPLPGNLLTLMGLLDASVGVPQSQLQINKFERDDARLDFQQLGTPIAFCMSGQERILPPRDTLGVSVVAAAPGQGNRTITVYMCNIWDTSTPTPSVYRSGVSAGRESALSRSKTFTLTDTEALQFVPEVLPNTVGFYRRYYFTCEQLGINAPVRVRALVAGLTVDTVNPNGGVTLTPNTSVTTLQSQSFQSTAIRYVPTGGVYQNYNLYPHPSSNTDFIVRYLMQPPPMLEDQDTPLIPAAHAQIIAYSALEQVTLKHSSPALSEVYRIKKEKFYRGMEQAFLGQPMRRVVKGDPTSGMYIPNPFGPLKYTP